MKTDFPEATQELEEERQRLRRALELVLDRLETLVPSFDDRRSLKFLVRRKKLRRLNK